MQQPDPRQATSPMRTPEPQREPERAECSNPWHRSASIRAAQQCAECPEAIGERTDDELTALAAEGAATAVAEIDARLHAGMTEARAAITVAEHHDPNNPAPFVAAAMAAHNGDGSLFARGYQAALQAYLNGRDQAAKELMDVMRATPLWDVPDALADLIRDRQRAFGAAEADHDATARADDVRGYVALLRSELAG